MYVYFDASGVLKEIITEKSFRNGDSKRDKIYVYWEGNNAPVGGWIKYLLPNNTEYPVSSEQQFYGIGIDMVGKALPTKPLRNLKYFSYDHTYEEDGETHIGYKFYEIEVPDAVLNSSSVADKEPKENNTIIARIRFAFSNEDLVALGALVFSVEDNIGIITDSSINETQYNYLIRLLSMKIGLNTTSVVVNGLPSQGQSGTIYYVRIPNQQYIYSVYVWTGASYAYLGNTTYGLYTEAEGEAFETSIRTLVQSLTNASPKGVYATLLELETAYPTGTTGIYLVSADGHWYYWDGEEWADGGAYMTANPDSELSLTSNNAAENSVITKNILETKLPSNFGLKKNAFSITEQSINLASYKGKKASIWLKGEASKNIFPLLVDGTYTNNSLTVVVQNGVITSAVKTSGSDSTLEIMFRESFEVRTTEQFILGYKMTQSSGTSDFLIYLRSSSSGLSNFISLNRNKTQSDIFYPTANGTVDRIRIFQLSNQAYNITFDTPIYMNEDVDDAIGYQPYGVSSSAKVYVNDANGSNKLPPFVDGTYSNNGCTIVVENGVIVSAEKTVGTNDAMFDIPFKSGYTLQLATTDTLIYGFGLSGSGTHDVRVYLRSSSGQLSSGIQLTRTGTESATFNPSSAGTADRIRVYQLANETYDYTFVTPLYLNKGLSHATGYEPYGKTTLFNYDYVEDGEFKNYVLKVTDTKYILTIVDGLLPIVYGKSKDDPFSSYIDLDEETLLTKQIVKSNLIFENAEIPVFASANQQFQHKEIPLKSGFKVGDTLILTIKYIENCKVNSPIKIFFKNANGQTIQGTDYNSLITYQGARISNWRTSHKVPEGTESIVIRFVATVTDTFNYDFTTTYHDVKMYCGSVEEELDLIDKMMANKVNSKQLALYAKNVHIKSIAHQGCRNFAPAGSIQSFVVAKQKGFDGCEFDVNLSKDGKYLITHGSSLEFALYDPNGAHDNNGYLYYIDGNGNGYWYDSDGDQLYTYDYENDEYVSSAVSLASLTRVNYRTAIQDLMGNDVRRLDYGTWFGPQFAGTHILDFEETMNCLKDLGLMPSIDFKITLTSSIVSDLYEVVHKLGMEKNTMWNCQHGYEDADIIRSFDPHAALIFGMPPTSAAADQLLPYVEDGLVYCAGRFDTVTEEEIGYCLERDFLPGVWFDDTEDETSEEYIFNILLDFSRKGCVLFTLANYKYEDAVDYKYFQNVYYK